MAKVLEGPGMGLLQKWGMTVPQFAVATSPDRLAGLAEANPWLRERRLVVKAHEAIGGRMKLGLVKVDLDWQAAQQAAKEMLGRSVSGLVISQVIISEMIPHRDEYYLAITSTRDGSEILLASVGGIEIESQWERVQRLPVVVGEAPRQEDLRDLAKRAGFSAGLIGPVTDFSAKLCRCFDQEDAQYLEINPLVSRTPDGALVALDSVTLLDADARFRHPDWTFSFAAEFGRPYTDREKTVMAVDATIKASVKFIEIPGGDTALLPAGGGASVFYADAVAALGGRPANYAEYSGDPPDWAVEALTDQVCSLPGIKRIIVGGAIANFTNVKKTFTGIISGFRKAKAKGLLNGVEIWVRRGGPYEQEGLAAMRALEAEGFTIHVYDRHTPMTDIVDLALKGTPQA